ncbi:hypothetical protein ABVK25_010709 [Lepraria finkii]|uniref:Yeast cell wall synthesis Kre9/Knh1-like N-terminal domain-containing protein n=1 Tax=Lepraria finkii TaxID=1340010 RepID=A0ABR4AV75_9LECA
MYIATATLAFLTYIGLSMAAGCARQEGAQFTDGSLPIGSPGLNQVVPAGQPFTITWTPTPKVKSVSIVLLIGPSTDIQDLSCIVNDIPNSGSYVWTPSNDLVPYGNHNYGLKIISDESQNYKFQFSTQFGISNSNVQSSASASPSKTKTGDHSGHTDSTSGTVTATSHHMHTRTHITPSYAVSLSSHSSHSKSHSKSSILVVPSSGFPTASKNSTHAVTSHHKTKTLASTGGFKNSTEFVKPTKHMSKPTSLAPITSVAVQTASTPPPAQVPSLTTSPIATSPSSAAAVRMVAGGMLAGLGGLAVFVF